jgi:hypothetical protein
MKEPENERGEGNIQWKTLWNWGKQKIAWVVLLVALLSVSSAGVVLKLIKVLNSSNAALTIHRLHQ